ncbi:MAG: NAD(P)H-dependent oxidoreductase [Verrucomicrobiota bacterium]|nr:NAD(P)H-dependent oxidoreductase [Verrucomicrobiota bacterium]
MSSQYLVISTSLNPKSKSRILAAAAFEALQKNGDAELVDARDFSLPFCDADAAYGDPNVIAISEKIRAARCVILGLAVYNYSTSGWAKNLIELTGDAWNEKIVGFLCASGGHRSYMSVMSLANSLMLDFECLIIPRFVHTAGNDFEHGKIKDPDVKERVEKLVKAAIRCAKALPPS